MINGINLNDPAQNQITFQPSINTVSEFKVDNSTFSAEYGRNSGAIVNIATRSGSNAFHGEGFEFFRDSALDSRNYFNQEPVPQSPFRRNQFGANLGGPVVKGRTFFFGTYEGLRQRQGIDINSGVLRDDQRAAVTDPVSRNLLPLIPTANAIGAERGRPLPRIGDSPRRYRPVHGRRPPQREQRRRGAPVLRVPARPPRRADAAAEHGARLRRHEALAPADHDVQRDPYLRFQSRERGPIRVQPHRHHVRAERQAEPARLRHQRRCDDRDRHPANHDRRARG